jgi:hypothetical protein
VANGTAQSGTINVNAAACLDQVAGGTVTNVATGIGLTGGPITTSGTIAADTTYLQRRVSGTCAAGSSVRTINADGTVVCETDDVGGGTVTSVATGAGLTGGPITGSGTIGVANAGITAAMLAGNGCTSGQLLKWNGSAWVCANDIDTNAGGTVTSVTAGGGLTGGTITTSGTIAIDPASSALTGNFFKKGGNAFGGVATLGTTDNNALELAVDGARVMRYEPNAASPNLVAGHPNNSVGLAGGQTVAGGGQAGDTCVEPMTGTFTRSCGNHATDAMATVSGGTSNRASGQNATVGGGYANTASESQSVVGGGGGNIASAFSSVVGGGSTNVASGSSSVIGGGVYNQATGAQSAIAGGISNNASGARSLVAGGNGNIASGVGSFVGGGGWNGSTAGNVAGAAVSTIAGGYGNEITADGSYGFIGGGNGNKITAPAGTNLAITTIGGGQNNVVSLGGATIAGGNSNQAGGFDASVGGGNSNVASGGAATIPGGISNTAAGNYSFAAGRRAKAGYDGAFLWADSTDLDFRVQLSEFSGAGPGWANAANTFNVRATGGVWFVTAVDAVTGRPTAGVFVNPGSGSWGSTSDRESKTAFTSVDVADILDRVARLPITRWRYRAEGEVEHVGPMAQDFHRAFGLGPDERSITAVDADGVALAAIQGLNAKLETKVAEQSREIESQRAELADLRDRLAQLESLRGDLAAIRETLATALVAPATVASAGH